MAKKSVRYEVIRDFKDLQDGNKIYTVGDTYPKPANKKVDDTRLKQLLSADNRQKQAVIKEAEEETAVKDTK